MARKPVFLYAAVYGDIATAEADYDAVFDLHDAGALGTFDSALVRKDENGKDTDADELSRELDAAAGEGARQQ